MTTCIYCKAPTTGNEGEAHIFPEAIMKNSEVLPRGAVCDSCNQYLGHLDNVLASHPFISLGIQVHATPGKTGKPRAIIGNVDRTVYPYGITIPCAEPQPIFDATGRRVGFNVMPLYPSQFDLSKFRRALHHVAFNLAATMLGATAVLAPRYDAARKYIRQPHKSERWPFGQYVVSLEHIDKVIRGALYDGPEEEYVGVRFFQVVFFVDLLATGGLKEFLDTQQPPGTTFVEEDYAPPVDDRSSKKRYRFTIVLDESHPDAP